MKYKFSVKGKLLQEEIESSIENFNSIGTLFGEGNRNSIRVIELDTLKINIKSFKIPNAINKIAYRFFRKSKAERSFNYAKVLINKGFGTPYPLAFFEKKTNLSFGASFYVSEHLECDLTYRELVTDPDYSDHEEILRAFTRFTFELHEKEIEFLDHSPGNTLIKIEGKDYKFYLVDLNRMNFKKLNFTERMINFSRLTPRKDMVKIMANEYASLIQKPETEVFEKMWFFTNQFQEKFKRKKALKKKLKFWKK